MKRVHEHRHRRGSNSCDAGHVNDLSSNPTENCHHDIGLRCHNRFFHFLTATDDDESRLDGSRGTGEEDHRGARAIGVDFVRSGCRHVPLSAGDLSMRVEYLGESSIAVKRPEGGGDERLGCSRARRTNTRAENRFSVDFIMSIALSRWPHERHLNHVATFCGVR